MKRKHFFQRKWLCGLIFVLTPILIGTPLVSATSRGIQIAPENGQNLYLYDNYTALIIGVSDYEKWPKLPYAVDDAMEVAAKLKALAFDVKLVLDPTFRELKTVLNEMVYKMGQEENRALLLYYAGHGETETLADKTKMGYLIPKDCPLINDDPIGFTSHAVSMRDIETISLRIRSKHVLMLFDSCFSGSIFALDRAVPEDISEKSNLPVRQFITAGREDEQVPDKSIFKRSFLIGLEGDADLTGDGYITGSELGMYLSEKVVNYSHRKQHPQYGKISNPDLDRGDFIFVPAETRQKLAALGQQQPTAATTRAAPEIASDGAKTSEPKPAAPKEKLLDSKYETLFWESIKDSNDKEMYVEYLSKFPNGMFAGLAKIKIQKLSKAAAEEPQEEKMQAKVAPAPVESPKTDQRLKLAVFPWRYDERGSAKGTRLKMEEQTIKVLNRLLSRNASFDLVFSYYDGLGRKKDVKKIGEDVLTEDAIDEMWIRKKDLTGRKPNLSLISNVGSQLKVDLVFTCYSFYDSKDENWHTDLHLINIEKKTTFSESEKIYFRTISNEIKNFTERFFENYSTDHIE